MAKTKKTADDSSQIDNKEEVFEEGLDTVDETESEPLTEQDEANDLSEILADPTKAVKIVQEEQDENEEVLYCPNCGVTGLFVDNVCMNCGIKKSKKSYGAVDEDDDMMDFGQEETINIEEF